MAHLHSLAFSWIEVAATASTEDKQAIDGLVAAKLAAMRDGRPVITPMGRKAVVRGSPSLWDTSG